MADINRLHLYIIAGCNGAGKTTASFTVLPEMLNCREFVNADEIAKGLSPFNPEGVAIQAGRLMIDRVLHLLKEGETFAFETTLATRSYVNLIQRAQKRGYFVTLLFFSLSTPEQAVARVAKRRYDAGLQNFFQLYTPICDYWTLYDNSNIHGEKIAYGWKSERLNIVDEGKYFRLYNTYAKAESHE